MSKRPNKLTERDKKDMVQFYNAGMSLYRLAKAFDVDHTTVWHHMKNLGANLRTRSQPGEKNPFHRGGWFHDKKAISAVNLALKAGKLIRPENCEKCGTPNKKTASGKSYLHGHHCDYNKPLEVMWLCKKCHHEWHEHNKAIPKKELAVLMGSEG